MTMKVEIAEYILKHLKTIPTKGVYIQSDQEYYRLHHEERISNLPDLQQHCMTCAIGSIFLSLLYLTKNDPTLYELQTSGMEKRDAILQTIFDKEQLDLIEQYYEGWNAEGSRKYPAWRDQFKTNKEVLDAIAQNIIDNNGVFIPIIN